MYTKTIIITEEMLDGISSGEIVIKCGQWVQYRWLKNKSRWTKKHCVGRGHLDHFRTCISCD